MEIEIEIKMRCWSIEYKEMYYGFNLQTWGDDGSIKDIQPCGSNARLMLAIGFKDKNGKEIYQSDIIQDDEGDTYLVYWNDDLCGFRCDLIGAGGVGVYDEFSIKEIGGCVIGNKYENPNLLK